MMMKTMISSPFYCLYTCVYLILHILECLSQVRAFLTSVIFPLIYKLFIRVHFFLWQIST